MFTIMEKIEDVILSITHGYMEYKPLFYGLSKKIKNARKNCFRFSGIVKLTLKVDSSLSNLHVCYFLKLPMPKRYRQFFRINSQKPDYVKCVCNDSNNPFLFARRR